MYKIINPHRAPIDLFWYELLMMNGTFNSLKSKRQKNQPEKDALVESFLIHARNIIDFLSNNRQKQDDLTCSDFNTSNGEPIHAIKILITPSSKNHKTKIDKHLSHLTKTRTKEKIVWDILDIRHALNQSSKIFLEQCSQKHFPSLEIKQKCKKIVNSYLDTL